MGKHILVIGSLNMDLSITMERMPAVGETVMGEELTYNLGGKGANQAYAVGRLGGQVKMLGCVGRDQFGAGQRESLAACGVDVSGLRESKALPTGTAVIYVDAAGSNSIVVVAGANQACDTQYLKENDHLFQWCDYVLMQMEIPMSAIAYAAGRARALGKTGGAVVLCGLPDAQRDGAHEAQRRDRRRDGGCAAGRQSPYGAGARLCGGHPGRGRRAAGGWGRIQDLSGQKGGGRGHHRGGRLL